MLIDTHCHLQLPPLDEQLDRYLNQAAASGVVNWLVPSVTPQDWDRISELARSYPSIIPAYGIHPRHAAKASPADLKRLEQLARQGAAIGEIGLDRNLPDLDQQETLFRLQLRIARQHNLPVLIHCCRMIGKTITILQQETDSHIGGIMHAFSGSLESAHQCIKLGFAIALTDKLQNMNSERYYQIATRLPLEHLVLETDAPAAGNAPRNRPTSLYETAVTLAAIRGCALGEIAARTSATARRIVPALACSACYRTTTVLELCSRRTKP